MTVSFKERTALNGICPYFTMFPLDFPLSILKQYSSEGEWVLDPFSGRGTTNYASRILGLPSIGIDSSPVAVALSWAKIANARPEEIVFEAQKILDGVSEPSDVPTGQFWEWAFHPNTLHQLCRLREGLLSDCRSDARKALRAILLGALHGPQGKAIKSYFSNQCPRTYAPKPRYAVKYWQTHDLRPKFANAIEIIERRAERYYRHETPCSRGYIIDGDCRSKAVYADIENISWVITSPPYYGIRTYIPDQWLRGWFLGGLPQVLYRNDRQLEHTSQNVFVQQLRSVWQHVGSVCLPGARLVVRFGGINNRKVDSLSLILRSLDETSWTVNDVVPAGSALDGRRQAWHFSHPQRSACEEHDISAQLDG